MAKWFTCDVCERRLMTKERHHGIVAGIETIWCEDCDRDEAREFDKVTIEFKSIDAVKRT